MIVNIISATYIHRASIQFDIELLEEKIFFSIFFIYESQKWDLVLVDF